MAMYSTRCGEPAPPMKQTLGALISALIALLPLSPAQAAGDKQPQAAVTAAYVATGDFEALKSSCYGQTAVTTCLDEAFLARVAALKAKTAKPRTCREYGFANELFMNGSEPLRVSLTANPAVGFFQGEVIEIDGKAIAIFNGVTQQNGVVLADKAMLYGANISVGSTLIGYGTQVRVSKAKTVAGVTTNIAIINAVCLGDQ